MDKLLKQFKENIIKDIKSTLKKENVFEVPQIEKVIVSTGTGDFKDDKNAIEKIAKEMAKITGQKANVNLSKKAVSAFKLRIGQPVGLTVTLRGERMYDFVNRLVNIALPRVRDFRGLKLTSFDNQGNYSIGLRDYSIFPEIKYEDITVNFGLEICIKTTANNKEDARVLLEKLGFPFEKGIK
jgi:large subunit ribosomal protein L5